MSNSWLRILKFFKIQGEVLKWRPLVKSSIQRALWLTNYSFSGIKKELSPVPRINQKTMWKVFRVPTITCKALHCVWSVDLPPLAVRNSNEKDLWAQIGFYPLAFRAQAILTRMTPFELIAITSPKHPFFPHATTEMRESFQQNSAFVCMCNGNVMLKGISSRFEATWRAQKKSN